MKFLFVTYKTPETLRTTGYTSYVRKLVFDKHDRLIHCVVWASNRNGRKVYQILGPSYFTTDIHDYSRAVAWYSAEDASVWRQMLISKCKAKRLIRAMDIDGAPKL